MRKTILKTLILIFFLQNTASASSFSRLSSMLESETLTNEQYNEINDILESGVESEVVSDVRDLTSEERILVENKNINEVTALASLENLQKFSEKQIVGYGQWGFHFIFIDNSGQRHELTSYKMHEAIRPASTLKMFSSFLAFEAQAETRENLKEYLHRSLNGMADEALRKTVNQTQFVLPSNSYLNDPALLNYKMWDDLELKDRFIDQSILRGCGLMIEKYSSLEDAALFHPVNGSGLQMTGIDTAVQTNLLTPRFETDFLERLYAQSEKYNSYKTLLPSPGATRIVKGKVARFGSLSTHFVEGRTLAKIYAKTGTLGKGKGLAGYAEAANGTLIFSILSDKLQGIDRSAAMSGPIEKIVVTHLKFLGKK